MYCAEFLFLIFDNLRLEKSRITYNLNKDDFILKFNFDNYTPTRHFNSFTQYGDDDALCIRYNNKNA